MDSVIRWPSCFLSLALFLVSLSRLAATLQTADRDPASHPGGRGLKHPASETSSIANNLEAVLNTPRGEDKIIDDPFIERQCRRDRLQKRPSPPLVGYKILQVI